MLTAQEARKMLPVNAELVNELTRYVLVYVAPEAEKGNESVHISISQYYASSYLRRLETNLMGLGFAATAHEDSGTTYIAISWAEELG